MMNLTTSSEGRLITFNPLIQFPTSSSDLLKGKEPFLKEGRGPFLEATELFYC